MGSINLHKLKTEKANKVQKHRQLRKIANLFRYVEMCVVLVLISRLSFQQLPLALKNSSEYFREFTVSPRFVFLIGNIIIVTLFAQSGHFSPQDSDKSKGSEEHDFYLEFLKNSTMYHKIQVVDQKKMRIKVENNIKGRRINGCMMKISEKESKKSGDDDDNGVKLEEKQGIKTETSLELKEYRRCQSEITIVGGVNSNDKKDERALQRCESEKSSLCSYPEDGMSSDEFRQTVEAFIARQQKLRIHEFQNLYS
ncbi:uncharacterized protein [Cicer arietinum]|uniref:Uncharacterized protein LOC101490934 n=1 Tax=Cicer arietinum TaxID=3827 RepID=A0A1S2Y929_CICAR|nr:uncharacterized protein LOC101490934 [Cicer arietinum]